MMVQDSNRLFLMCLAKVLSVIGSIHFSYHPDIQEFKKALPNQNVLKISLTVSYVLLSIPLAYVWVIHDPFITTTFSFLALLCYPVFSFFESRVKNPAIIKFLNAFLRHHKRCLKLRYKNISPHWYFIGSVILKIVLISTVYCVLICRDFSLANMMTYIIFGMPITYASVSVHSITLSVNLVLTYLVQFESGLNVALEKVLQEVNSKEFACTECSLRLKKVQRMSRKVKRIAVLCNRSFKILDYLKCLVSNSMLIIVASFLLSFTLTDPVLLCCYLASIVDILAVIIYFRRLEVEMTTQRVLVQIEQAQRNGDFENEVKLNKFQ